MTCNPAISLLPILLCSALTLNGCAAPNADFPELKRRAIEDLPVDDQPVKRASGLAIMAMPDDLREQVAALLLEAKQADESFQSDLAKTRRAVGIGRSAGRNSENWSVAQTEISALSRYHNRSINALSALDTLSMAETEKQYTRDAIYDLRPIAEAQAEIERLVAAQRGILTDLSTQLR
ncbi:hypothetical protein [Alterisphingorhabdus coralli]|uniref:DUF4142 domain-containing protein n=1 Tax=Alterisphingorhabdus coralli TaxID=3071408 RepID=A0AA97I0D0_9SPHN|nr:hypothetical protein [Parasphingorhabdus sp. SCSIO 66989]WOE74792.1 hypothetical protein RB602_13235 [Parasphingorhabdus sp. SCSIO 66989]